MSQAAETIRKSPIPLGARQGTGSSDLSVHDSSGWRRFYLRERQRRLSPLCRLLTFALLLTTSAFPADFTGTWVGQYSGRNGEPIDVALQIKQDGKSLSGKLYGDYHSAPIVESTISGTLVTFVVKSQEQAGNQINDTKLRFTGRLNENGELELVRDRESSTNAGNKGGAPARQETKLILKLRKLI